MKIILLSLMMVCLFDYHVNCCVNCLVSIQNTYQYNPDRISIELLLQEIENTHCHGFAEIRSEFNGTETIHGRISVDDGETLPKKASKLRYRSMPGGRAANKIIEVQGNCCWTFYQRFRYAGDMRSVRGRGTLTSSFAPRSLKAVEC